MQTQPTDFYILLPIMTLGAFFAGIVLGSYMERRRNIKKQNLYERAAMIAMRKARTYRPKEHV